MASASQLDARVRHRSGVAIVDLAGPIDGSAEAALSDAYAEVEDEPTILLDFRAVDYINSTGIALIVGLLTQARKNRQAVTGYGLTDHYREIFEITRLADFMAIVADEETAVGENSDGRS